jgi:flagellar hook assembly protein FlgD
MKCGKDVVIQVTTQQKNPDGSYSVAEALTTAHNKKIVETTDQNGNVVSRTIEEI